MDICAKKKNSLDAMILLIFNSKFLLSQLSALSFLFFRVGTVDSRSPPVVDSESAWGRSFYFNNTTASTALRKIKSKALPRLDRNRKGLVLDQSGDIVGLAWLIKNTQPRKSTYH